MHLHSVFHVSLLEPYIGSSIPDRVVLTPPPVQLVDVPEFEVKVILDSKIVRKKLYYIVDWLSYTPNDRTWELAENLDNSSNLVLSPTLCIRTRGTRHQSKEMVS